MEKSNTTEFVIEPKELVKRGMGGGPIKVSEMSAPTWSIRETVKQESPAERMLNFAKLYNGMFSLDAQSLEYLSKEPLDVDVLMHMEMIKAESSDCLEEEFTAKQIRERLDQLKGAYQDAMEADREERDLKLKEVMDDLEAFRLEHRIKFSEENNQEKSETNSISQLEL